MGGVEGLLLAAEQSWLAAAVVDSDLLDTSMDVTARLESRAGRRVPILALEGNRLGIGLDRNAVAPLSGAGGSVGSLADAVRDGVDALLDHEGGSAGRIPHWLSPTEDIQGRVELFAAGTGSAILVAEDEPGFRLFLCEALAEDGHRVWAASNALDALGHLASHTVDLVLSDLNMPGMSGLEFFRELRRSEATRRLPFIAITAWPDALDGARKEEGLVVLPKPLPLAQLFAAVESALAGPS